MNALFLLPLLFPPLAPFPRAVEDGNTPREGSQRRDGCPTRYEKTLAPGVTLTQELLPEGAEGGPQVVSVVKVAPGVGVRAALGQGRVWGLDATSGRETVSNLAKRTGALVAVNAGFFPFLGNPIGLHVEDGELVTEPQLSRASLVIDEKGRASVGAFTWSGSVEGRPLHALNRKPGKGNELLLFTPKFFERTLKTPERFEAVLSGAPSPLRPGSKFVGKVESVSEGGETPLSPGTVVLSAGGESASWLREKATPGTELTVDLAVAPVAGDSIDVAQIRHAVTGAGRLLKGGRPALSLPAEKLQPSFSTTRHPRTAAGVAEDGSVLLVTVDGRQTGLSRGMSLAELTALLQRLRAVDAVNLDGGGSTALAIHGGIVNSPSDAAERPVADMLVVGQSSAADEAPLPGPLKPLTVGEKFAFAPPEKTESGVWSQSGGAGFIDQSGLFTALRPGKATIRFTTAHKRFVATIAVTPPLAPSKTEIGRGEAKGRRPLRRGV
jgi:hypothetical protein